jgi:ACR3 family arsenite efflux pump ArsB
MGANLIKMFLVLIFLIPLIQSDIIADKSLDMLAVIIPYFLFLIFETVFSIDLINKK